MAFSLFQRRRGERTISALYGAIVAQARQPAFYADYGVPDTPEGRFELIVLHLALLVRRLRAEPEEARALGQGVFDAFCTDMDHNLREMGVSDIAVPRRMRRLGEAFYGRAAAYDRALDRPASGELAEALRRNVFAGGGNEAQARRLALYVRAAAQALERQPASGFARGALEFPHPTDDLVSADKQ